MVWGESHSHNAKYVFMRTYASTSYFYINFLRILELITGLHSNAHPRVPIPCMHLYW